MKNLLFILLPFIVFSQNHTVQIELYDYVTGMPESYCGAISNDAGLNLIFQNHNVYQYCAAPIISYPSLDEVGGGLIDCYGCNASALIADLQAYSSVISRARLTPGQDYFANHGFVKLIETASQIGSSSSNVVITSNSNLNDVFLDHTVFYFDHVIDNWYELKCDCYSPDLFSSLISQNLILPNSSDSYDNHSFATMVYLSNPTFDLNAINIYPNPYRELKIENVPEGTEFWLSDITGKIIIARESSERIQMAANLLLPGIYFLRLEKDNKTKVWKLIKQ